MENQQQSSAAAEAEAEKTHTDTHQNSALINSFCEITCASQSEALFFLESHNFDLDAAVSTFLESTNPTITAAAAAVVSGAAATNPIQSPSRSRSRSPSYSPSLSESSLSPSRSRSPSPHRSRHAQYNLRSSKAKAPSASATGGGAGRRAGGGGGGVRTLADLNRGTNDDGPDSDPEYQPPEYYTGGEKSGMLVQDPSKGNDVDAIFNDARQLGALEGSVENHRPSSSSKSFTGTGRLLSGETVLPAPQQPEERTHNIIFWNNGFTVNDGPLRRFDDPENASFLESIRRSECPKELEPSDKRSAVHVSLIRKEENCPVLEKRKAPFQGVGRTLGSTSNTTSTEPTAADTSLTTAPAPSMGLVVDETLPTTSIQLRLGDGTRMVSRFNYHHTIRDIRGFIDASRPGGPRTYQLQTVGFPPKQLTDLDQTIEQAGLANSVVIQKLS